MKYEILKIEKRNPLIRIFTINHWKVTVKLGDYEIKSFVCWASINNPDENYLLNDLNERINNYLKKDDFSRLIGSEFEV